MNKQFAVIVTSISSPNKALKAIASKCLTEENFFVVGDLKSPSEFNLNGCQFFSLEKQKQLTFKFISACPEGYYSRKNIGYLIAMERGYKVIVETDDDNIPLDDFWNKRKLYHKAIQLNDADWVNIYQYFAKEDIWPRGFPLEYINQKKITLGNNISTVESPIQQGLVDANPDVDAVFRMTRKLPLYFEKRGDISLGKNSKCSFNSQNTTWFQQAFPLLYLPSYCNFRMTDIWRSFIAQRILWTCNWNLLFHNATVYQERNWHNLLKDFEHEISGYLNNAKIFDVLTELDLNEGKENIFDNLHKCYKAFIKQGCITDEKELKLLDLWIDDVIALNSM